MNKKKTQTPQQQSSGLGELSDLSSLLDAPASGGSNRPVELPVDLIDEDPNQPRRTDNPGFSKESIAELAATIKSRGVKSPISVRDNDGRYIINHGARRYRAAKIAGLNTIPAFVDNDYNEADQVIENVQRDNLTPREIADFIGRELARGKKKVQIAESIGKSPAYVTQHVTLLDLPEPIALAFSIGRVTDVTLINELAALHKKMPEQVETWLADDSLELTRRTLKELNLGTLKKMKEEGVPVEEDADAQGSIQDEEEEATQKTVEAVLGENDDGVDGTTPEEERASNSKGHEEKGASQAAGLLTISMNMSYDQASALAEFCTDNERTADYSGRWGKKNLQAALKALREAIRHGRIQ